MKSKTLQNVGSVAVMCLTLFGCVTSNQKLFSSVEPAKDPSYGYTAENPIAIKNTDLSSSVNSSYYFLSQLRSSNGNKLEIIRRYSVDNPNYTKAAAPVVNQHTGAPLSYGTGPFLDFYMLKPVNEADTIKLYINPYHKGEIKVPVGLQFEKE
ncbi:hypothetical protein [Pontibacter actiniarum]|uniref:Lipoprotein n=2 Tax=Pontibacter actiniarum TaxID=323450 RepID=A0A1X9YRX9_9BACT|nr:hypothetical protein [Pontibacter actiniarum]ARS35650.1 hypothetical protein CA264_09460 [Pontibacter actiniarum]